MKSKEKRVLRSLLHSSDERRLGAIGHIWDIIDIFSEADFSEEQLQMKLERRAPEFRTLLKAIRAYETYSRSLQDAFDILRHEGWARDASGYQIVKAASIPVFVASVAGLRDQFEIAHNCLGEVGRSAWHSPPSSTIGFLNLVESMRPEEYALALCRHHEDIQKQKSATGKRPWFDRLSESRIFVRHCYRLDEVAPQPSNFVHTYRGYPVRRFYTDLL